MTVKTELKPCYTNIEKFPPLYDVEKCPFCGADREYIVAEEYEHGAGKRWRVFCLSCMAAMDKGYCQTKCMHKEVCGQES